MFFKVIKGSKIIDVLESPYFLRFLPSGHIAFTDRLSAQGITSRDCSIVYSLQDEVTADFCTVSVEEISIEEFRRLKGLLNSCGSVSADEHLLAQAKDAKISSLSASCKEAITNGFTIKLSNGKQHFRLTAEDQLNLTIIENQLAAGEIQFIYHATNQPCKLYSREDMVKIVRAFRKHVLYHTTYYNAVKQHVNSLLDVEKVNSFSYGTDISEMVKDPAIRQILKNGGS